jgi:hypothetical protein
MRDTKMAPSRHRHKLRHRASPRDGSDSSAPKVCARHSAAYCRGSSLGRAVVLQHILDRLGSLAPRRIWLRAYHCAVILRRTNPTALRAVKFAAMLEERSNRLDEVDRAIAKIRSLLPIERKRVQQQQPSLVERAKRIRKSA